MKKVCFFICGILILSFNVNAKEFEKFCKGVPSWPKGQDVRKNPGLKVYEDVKLGKPIGAKFAIQKLSMPGWLVIDARDKATRETTGRVIGALQIVSDYQVKADNEFTLEKLLKSLNSKRVHKHLKKRSMAKIENIADLKKQKYILFCNGFKCHRSSFAACQLRDMGVPFKNIYLALGGFDDMKSSGAKTR
jgi:rhodanese-related sulfurtransferase